MLPIMCLLGWTSRCSRHDRYSANAPVPPWKVISPVLVEDLLRFRQEHMSWAKKVLSPHNTCRDVRIRRLT